MATKKTVNKKPGASRAPAKKPTPAHLRIGEYSKEHGGAFAGIFPGGKGEPDVHLFVATTAAALAFQETWGPTSSIAAESETDGMANTQAMAAAGSPLAKKALSLKIDGHKDYYVASRREARLIAAAAPEIYGSTGWRWTSTQDRYWADLAWVQDFDDGYQRYSRKSHSRGVVFVRRVTLR